VESPNPAFVRGDLTELTWQLPYIVKNALPRNNNILVLDGLQTDAFIVGLDGLHLSQQERREWWMLYLASTFNAMYMSGAIYEDPGSGAGFGYNFIPISKKQLNEAFF